MTASDTLSLMNKYTSSATKLMLFTVMSLLITFTILLIPAVFTKKNNGLAVVGLLYFFGWIPFSLSLVLSSFYADRLNIAHPFRVVILSNIAILVLVILLGIFFSSLSPNGLLAGIFGYIIELVVYVLLLYVLYTFQVKEKI